LQGYKLFYVIPVLQSTFGKMMSCHPVENLYETAPDRVTKPSRFLFDIGDAAEQILSRLN
jgi:hypothetical protein